MILPSPCHPVHALIPSASCLPLLLLRSGGGRQAAAEDPKFEPVQFPGKRPGLCRVAASVLHLPCTMGRLAT